MNKDKLLEVLRTLAQDISRARSDARILAHAYWTDSNPPDEVVERALSYSAESKLDLSYIEDKL